MQVARTQAPGQPETAFGLPPGKGTCRLSALTLCGGTGGTRDEAPLVVARTQALRRNRAVLVDKPTEHVAAFYRETCWGLWCGPAHRHAEVKTAMRSLLVVMADVLPQHRFEVAPPEHQRPVEALNASGPHEPLGERVRARRADRRLDDFGTFRPEYLVGTGGELRGPVPG